MLTETENLPLAPSFGAALRFLRKRSRLTQDELGRAVGYSREQIARLENGSRLPDLAVIAALFIPALDLNTQIQLTQQFLKLAGQARSDGATNQKITVTRTVQTRTQRVLEVISEAVPQFNVPAPVFPILGRGVELEMLTDLIVKEARLVTLIGAPGIGKTRLALEVAHWIKAYFPDGVSFIGLETVQRVEDVPAVIAATLELTPSVNQSISTQLRSFLAPRNMLLVLDNCEHILDSVREFAEWLSAAPGLKLLCTSRVALDLYGEYIWDVSPLALPDLSNLPPLDELAQVASVKLFMARARTTNAAFTLHHENALAVAALCTALDGLPLAIEIAAARTHDLSVYELLQQIVIKRQPIPLSSTVLKQTKRNLAERHQTLNNAIAWSYQLLSSDQQQIFSRLGIMVGGCTLAAAQHICGATPDRLNDLAAASLLRVENERIVLLETLRAFAYEQLVQQSLLNEVQRAHADYFSTYAAEVFQGILGPDQERWLAKTRRDHDNFRLALSFALEHVNSDVAVSISGGLWWFWNRQGFIREGKQWLEKSLSLPISKPLNDAQKRSRATALNGAGSICTELGDFSAAMIYHEEGLSLRQALDDKPGISVILHNMGLVERSQGAYVAAIKLFEDSLALTETDNKSSLAMGYTNLGMTAVMMYDLPLAAAWLERALALINATDFPWETAYTLNVYATVCFEANDLSRAENLAQDSLHIFEKLGDAIYLPEPQLMLAKLAQARGDFQTMQELCDKVLKQYQKMDDRYGIANALHLLAWLALPANPVRAQELFAESQALRNAENHFLSPLEQVENQRLQAAIDGLAV